MRLMFVTTPPGVVSFTWLGSPGSEESQVARSPMRQPSRATSVDDDRILRLWNRPHQAW